MQLIVVGLSHKTAPIEVREKLAFPAKRQAGSLAALCGDDHITEAVILSTCNRTEIYAVCTSAQEGIDAVIGFMADSCAADRGRLQTYLYTEQGSAVVEHLFRVVSSLDSMVVGEAQILHQVKEAYSHSFEHKACGQAFNKLFRQSFEVGKRVRTETEIGENAVSVSYAAVELARKVFDSLEGRCVLVLGAGKMSELTARHLVSQGVAKVLVANRTYEHAVELASRFDGEAIPYGELFSRVREADIVISSTSATEPVITRNDLAPSLKGRGGRPLFLIDIAVPRDIEPAVNDLPNVFLYDIDDLNGVVESNLEERMREARRAEGIIAEEVTSFLDWLDSMEVVPTLTAMRAKAEVMRQAEVEKAFRRLNGLSDADRKTVEALSCAIVNKLLHGPTARLKAAAGTKEGIGYVESARYLYGLDDADPRRPGGALRNFINLKAREVVEDAKRKEMGDSIGC